MRRTFSDIGMKKFMRAEKVSRRNVVKAAGALLTTSVLLPFGARRSAAGTAGPFDYYISPNGSNTNAGTIDSPWSITALSSKSQIAGKRIGLLDGIYRLSGGNQDYIQGITFGGTSAAPTVIEAVTPTQAVITSNNGNGGYPQYGSIGLTGALQIEADYVTIRALKITDLAGHGINVHASNILIENCEISNIVGQRNLTYADTNCGGIYFKDSSLRKTNITVRNCLITDIRNRTNNDAGSGNQLPMPQQFSNGVGDLFGVSGLTIEYCTFERVGTPTYLKVNAGNVTMRYCFVNDCGSLIDMFSTVGAMPGNPADNKIYNNIAIVNRVGGAPSANVNGGAVSNCEFFNNTIILKAIDGNNDAADYGYITLSGIGAQALKIYNNIVYLDPSLPPATGLLRFVAQTQRPHDRLAVMDYNCYNRFQINDEVDGQVYATLGTWRSAIGKDLNSVISDPQLVNLAGASAVDFKSLASSNLLQAGRIGGVNTGAPTALGAWGGGADRVGYLFGVIPVAPQITSIS